MGRYGFAKPKLCSCGGKLKELKIGGVNTQWTRDTAFRCVKCGSICGHIFNFPKYRSAPKEGKE